MRSEQGTLSLPTALRLYREVYPDLDPSPSLKELVGGLEKLLSDESVAFTLKIAPTTSDCNDDGIIAPKITRKATLRSDARSHHQGIVSALSRFEWTTNKSEDDLTHLSVGKLTYSYASKTGEDFKIEISSFVNPKENFQYLNITLYANTIRKRAYFEREMVRYARDWLMRYLKEQHKTYAALAADFARARL